MKKIPILLIIFLSHNLLANDDWSAPTKITEINAGYKEGFILFRTEATHVNPNNCASDYYYAVREGDADLQIILSILLSAQRSGAKIQVGANSTQCDALGNRISVSRVRSL